MPYPGLAARIWHLNHLDLLPVIRLTFLMRTMQPGNTMLQSFLFSLLKHSFSGVLQCLLYPGQARVTS